MRKHLVTFLFFIFVICSFGENLTVEKIYDIPQFRGARISRIHWCFSNSSLIFYGEKNGIRGYFLFDLVRKKERTFIDFNLLLKEKGVYGGKIEDFRLSPDGKVFAFTVGGRLFLYDTELKRVIETVIDGNPSHLYFSTDSNFLSYVKNYNLYIYDLQSQKKIKVTNDGSKENLYGVWDWVYEEEFDLNRGTFWSPDSRFLIFVNLKEDGVRNYPLVYTDDKGYLRLEKYPYAGEKNPSVKVVLFDLLTHEKREIFSVDENSYIARIYTDRRGEFIYLVKLNRAQNDLSLIKIDLNNLNRETLLEERYDTWINVNDIFFLLKNNRDFIWGSERSGFLHLYLYKISDKSVKQITKGKWVVTSLVGVDEEKGKIFFTGTATSPLENHLYSVDFDGKSMIKLTEEEGSHTINMSPDFKYYVDEYSDTLKPDVCYLRSVESPSEKFLIYGNKMNIVERFNLIRPEFFKIHQSGREYYAMRYLPENFDKSKKYPVLIYVYGGPHYQVVKKRWKFTTTLFHEILAKKGYIVFSIDNRGSTDRGKTWEDYIFRHFGKFELEDQLMGVRYLKSLPYVDPKRIGIWGWSFGGYMTLFSLMKSPDTFRCGVSVAPVVDWKLYDSIYTERYMGMPSENKVGYFESSPINYVKDLKARLLLCFGTSDDNVHPVNSLSLIDKMIKYRKDFEVYIFPDQTHSISKKEDRIFLFRKILNFLDKNLKGEN